MPKKLTVYQRIMKAYKEGKGLRLSKEDVWKLAQDDAIETRANNDKANADGIPDRDLY